MADREGAAWHWPGFVLHEPATSLTDALIAVECVSLARSIAGQALNPNGLRSPFVAFFGATAVASGAGAVLHGLVPNPDDPRHRALWRASLAAIGVAAMSSWYVAARLGPPGRRARAERLALAGHTPYFVLVATGDRPYVLAVASYLPAAVAFSIALAGRLSDPAARQPAITGLAGLGVTFAAAGAQLGRIGLNRTFDHNAVYHALQAIGIGLLYRSAVGFLGRWSGDRR